MCQTCSKLLENEGIGTLYRGLSLLNKYDRKPLLTQMYFMSPPLSYFFMIFGMWVYNDELQIKFTFRSGPIIFGRVMALGL